MIGDFFSSPGILSEKLYAFAAYDLQRAKASPEEDEEIELAPAGLDEALDMIRYGQIKGREDNCRADDVRQVF